MSSSSRGSGAVSKDLCVKCGRQTLLWKSSSEKNPGKMYNRCPVHIFSHWCEDQEKVEDEVDSKPREDNTSMILRELIESNQQLQQEQRNTNNLLREVLESNQQQARQQEEQSVIYRLCMVLLVKAGIRE